jgi:hypothetical protein
VTKKILEKIEKLATKTADEAFSVDVKLGDKIEALKVLTPIYTLLKKADSRQEEVDETTMAGLKDDLEKAEHNGSEVQHSGRRRGAS